MAKIKKQYATNSSGEQELFYPATISDAVKFPDTSETLTEKLSHLSEQDNTEIRKVLAMSTRFLLNT